MGTAGAPGAIRTPDPLVRSQILYPTELRVRTNINDVVLPTNQPPSQSIQPSADQRGGELCTSLHAMSTVSCKISQLSGRFAARATHLSLPRSGMPPLPGTERPGKAGDGHVRPCSRPPREPASVPSCFARHRENLSARGPWAVSGINPSPHPCPGSRLPGASPAGMMRPRPDTGRRHITRRA